MTTVHSPDSRPSGANTNAGLWIPAGALIGVGVGLLFGQAGAGVLIGLGVGFVLMFLAGLLRPR